MNISLQTGTPHLAEQPVWFVHRGGIVPGTEPHWLSEALILIGAAAEAWADACAVRVMRVRSGTPLYPEGATTQALYVVRHGAFKCQKTAEDGYEHMLRYAESGDVLGFEGLACERQPLGVTALEDSSVLVLPLDSLDAWRSQSAALDRALQRALSSQLTCAQEIAGMMAAVASEVRLARFLVWMSQRMAARGQSPQRFTLRMSRRDLASLLAVAHETVSRGFGLLTEWGYIKVDKRNVEILDMPGLRACTCSTRRDMHDPHHPRPALVVTRPRKNALQTEEALS